MMIRFAAGIFLMTIATVVMIAGLTWPGFLRHHRLYCMGVSVVLTLGSMGLLFESEEEP